MSQYEKLVDLVKNHHDLDCAAILSQFEKLPDPYWEGDSAVFIRLFKLACDHGNLLAAKGFYERSIPSDNQMEKAMDNAIREGHLPVVQWMTTLPWYTNDGPTRRAESNSFIMVLSAIHYGKLEIVKHLYNDKLHRVQLEDCGNYRFIDICEQGYLDIAKWLYMTVKHWPLRECGDRMLAAAVKNGHVDVARWLIDIGVIPKRGSMYYQYYLATVKAPLKKKLAEMDKKLTEEVTRSGEIQTENSKKIYMLEEQLAARNKQLDEFTEVITELRKDIAMRDAKLMCNSRVISEQQELMAQQKRDHAAEIEQLLTKQKKLNDPIHDLTQTIKKINQTLGEESDDEGNRNGVTMEEKSVIMGNREPITPIDYTEAMKYLADPRGYVNSMMKTITVNALIREVILDADKAAAFVTYCDNHILFDLLSRKTVFFSKGRTWNTFALLYLYNGDADKKELYQAFIRDLYDVLTPEQMIALVTDCHEHIMDTAVCREDTRMIHLLVKIFPLYAKLPSLLQ